MDRERRVVLLLLLLLEAVIVAAVLIGIHCRKQPGSAEPTVEHQASNLSQVFQPGEKPPTVRGKTNQNHPVPVSYPHHPTNGSGDSILMTPVLPLTAADQDASPHLTPTPGPSTTLPAKKSDVTPEVADRTLKAAAVILVLMAVVTAVGLMHFKVCKEMKRACRDVEGPRCRNAPRFVRQEGYVHKLMLVLHKPKLVLRGLFGGRGQRDRVHCTTGQLLHPFSQEMTDPVGKSGGVYIEQEYV